MVVVRHRGVTHVSHRHAEFWSSRLTSRITGTVGFIAFNVGLPYYNSLGSDWEKFTLALYEGIASRASGFGIVTISDLAPATK